ncbi:MAG: BrnT family toxin [Rhodothermales bacterium]
MFEWDEKKRQSNIEKHGIDFVRAKEMWLGTVIEVPSPQTNHGEARFMAIGAVSDICITVIYTWRGSNKRLISARRARNYERENYYDAVR